MKIGDNNDGAVAGSFNFSAQLPNGKNLTFSGYVMAGENEEEVNAKLDFASRAVERQRLIAEIPELEIKLDQTREAQGQVQAQLDAVLAKGSKQSPQDRVNINTHNVNLKHLEKQVNKGIAAIEKSRTLVGA